MFTVDLKAPRRPRKPRKNLLTVDMFKTYQQSESYNKEIKDVETFKKIINLFSKKIVNKVIDNPYGIEIYNVGLLFLLSYNTRPDKKNNKSYFDAATSSAVGKRVQFNNFHTDGRYLKIQFTQQPERYAYYHFDNWYFNPCRDFKRKASAAFRENYKKYLFRPNTENLSTFLKNIKFNRNE